MLGKKILSRDAEETIQNILNKYKNNTIKYPWEGLEARLDNPNKPFYIVGYGSLLHPESAARTFPDTPPGGHPPVIAYGARRIYNYLTHKVSRTERDPAPPHNRVAALNTDYSGNAEDWINGRLIPLTADSLAGFREREVGYDLCPVVCTWWETDRSPDPETQLFQAWVLRATGRPWQGQVHIADDILPHPPYYDLCRTGAALVSPDYLQAFLETTFLADGKTSLLDWEAREQSEQNS